VVLLNFTDIWVPLFDLPNVTVAQVVADLNATSSIITDTLSFFNTFFGPTGFVTLSPPIVPSNATVSNTTVSTIPVSNNTLTNTSFGVNIPVGLGAIVQWITE